MNWKLLSDILGYLLLVAIICGIVAFRLTF